MKSYELLDHTADTGLKIYGRNLEELFLHGALGLYSLMTDVEDIRAKTSRRSAPTYRGRQEQSIRLRAEGIEALFFDWLRELLFHFSAHKRLFLEIRFQTLSETELDAACHGELFNAHHHRQRTEVKAVTLHQYYVRKTGDFWEAQVIFDI